MLGRARDPKAIKFLADNAAEKEVLTDMWLNRDNLTEEEKARYNELAKAWNEKADATDIDQRGLVNVVLL